ncbi:alkaline shock response membrane anchor protein AmaP [Mycolicibacterium hippocampi]|uniref:Alkaline shock response membrane anchor protein AmaP n=1 Tax=Mycolicibacterium hippocampi TaxID=659824 RepID=A0A850PR10_9MYCO|nr:alkaline shock response membrane anchor protein AmaP [Mycolicibacterium hippocampi]NVN52801.1 hypothetical protein [Mycolicibacterium hippocampi]
MTRSVTGLDRFAALGLGLLLIAVGAGLFVWNTNWIPGTPQMISAPGLSTASGTGWWPWAVAGVGLVLTITALRWLFAHSPKARVKSLRVVANDLGTVTADLGEVATAAANALERCPDAHSAKGKAVIDRGVRVIDLTVTAHSPSTLAELTESIDTVHSQIAAVLGDTTVATRTVINLDKTSRRANVS